MSKNKDDDARCILDEEQPPAYESVPGLAAAGNQTEQGDSGKQHPEQTHADAQPHVQFAPTGQGQEQSDAPYPRQDYVPQPPPQYQQAPYYGPGVAGQPGMAGAPQIVTNTNTTIIQPGYAQQQIVVTAQEPQNYMTHGILILLFCNLWMGIFVIYNSEEAKKYWMLGNYAMAAEKERKAKLFIKLGLIVGAVVHVVLVLAVISVLVL